jgi:hypothetical protein
LWMPRSVRYGSASVVVIPTWMVFLLFVTLGAAPWIHWSRYSLRTLLITITLVAIGLGLIVWLV